MQTVRSVSRDHRNNSKRLNLRGLRVVFVDKCIFTSNTLHDRAFSKSKQNVFFPVMPKNVKALRAAVGVSAENGLEGFKIYENSVNSERFIDSINSFTRLGSAVFAGRNSNIEDYRLEPS
jgi:hypothetical protein